MYDCLRYFTMTGNHLPGTPTTIEDRQAELEALHKAVFGPQPPEKPRASPRPAPTLDLSNQELIDKAHLAADGWKFAQLWKGDTGGYPSPSETTAALWNKLVIWCGPDPGRIDRLFRQSGLMRPKWDRPQSGSTWGAMEVDKALARATELYSPSKTHQAAQDLPPDWRSKPQDRPQAARQEAPAPRPPIATISFVTGAELQVMEFKEPEWIVENILPQELCLFSARPKKGKTWLAMGISVVKTTGGCAFSNGKLKLPQGKVLYLCLEDKLRRAKKRLGIILGGEPFPGELILAEIWPKLGKGGLAALRDFLKEHDDCQMVVIDSYAKVKPRRPKNVDPYDFDMAVAGDLQALAQERGVCILLIYHNRKSESEDPLDDVIGSTGLTGAVDAVLVLRRGRGQADGTLFVTGRDVEEQELALKFHKEDCTWELLGDAAEYAKSQERIEIINLLKEHGPKSG